jgi:hypothetical protein
MPHNNSTTMGVVQGLNNWLLVLHTFSRAGTNQPTQQGPLPWLPEQSSAVSQAEMQN